MAVAMIHYVFPLSICEFSPTPKIFGPERSAIGQGLSFRPLPIYQSLAEHAKKLAQDGPFQVDPVDPTGQLELETSRLWTDLARLARVARVARQIRLAKYQHHTLSGWEAIFDN